MINSLRSPLTMEQVRELSCDDTGVWVTPQCAERVADVLPFPQVSLQDAVKCRLPTLIVIGGGTMIDVAKATLSDAAVRTRLIAIPSIWGSGAEASPVVVLNNGGRKDIRIGAEFLPDDRAVWPELADSIPLERAIEACGDCWSHALEAFLSPLAAETLREELASLIRRMCEIPVGKDSAWFEFSAAACAAQAQASVGLVHGIAHTLEGPLSTEQHDRGWHHARLCSIFLWPVLEFNLGRSAGVGQLMRKYDLDCERIRDVARTLYSHERYTEALTLLECNWRRVLRDPCTRTNCVLVRPADLNAFLLWNRNSTTS